MKFYYTLYYKFIYKFIYFLYISFIYFIYDKSLGKKGSISLIFNYVIISLIIT